MFRRIVIAHDGTPAAEVALQTGTHLADGLDVPAHLIRVLDWTDPALAALVHGVPDSPDPILQDRERQLVARALRHLADVYAHPGLIVTFELREGCVSAGILATLQPGDLLILATPGGAGPDPSPLGEVASRVLREARNPVLIVPGFESSQVVTAMPTHAWA